MRLGGVIYTNFTTESIIGHTGAWDDHWINRDVLYVVFDYPFNQLGVNRIFSYLRAVDDHAIRFNENLGFEHVVTVDGMFEGNISCHIMKLERSRCRFLNIKPRAIVSLKDSHRGQEIQSASAA